ncbi:MAG: RNA methyltransferase [Ignavibacteriaceae bacterium]|nr:RNA methyltransferase [Ignavibacteriaceae bacterium]
MLTKNELKYYSSLLKKKNREVEKKFLVEGYKLVDEALNSKYRCDIIISTNAFAEREDEFIYSLQKKQIRVETVKNYEFEKISDTINPQGIAAVFAMDKEEVFIAGEIILALEDVSDPGNVGAILRNCGWFGVTSVILSETCADIFNPKTLRASMGSVFHLSIKRSQNFIDDISKLTGEGYSILTAHLTGENIYKLTLPEKLVIVFANEANGPSMELLNASDKLIHIPKFGKTESLNVANSSAVILSEIKRRESA